jgi:hypothetical protein
MRPAETPRTAKAQEQLLDRIRVGRAGNRCECESPCPDGHTGRCMARHGGTDPTTRIKITLTIIHPDPCVDLAVCDESHFRAVCPRCQGTAVFERRPQAAARSTAADAAAWMTPLFDDQAAA